MRSGSQQIASCRLLKALLHAYQQGSTLLQELVPGLPGGRIEFLDIAAHSQRQSEILALEVQPGLAGRTLKLRRVGVQRRLELLFALADDIREFRIATDGADGGGQLRQRTRRNDLVAVDGQPRASGGGDALFNSFQSRVALLGPSGPLGGRASDAMTAIDVGGKLQAQVQVFGGQGGVRPAAEVTDNRGVQFAAGGRDPVDTRPAGRLQIFGNRTIVGHQLLDHRARASGERLLLGLHVLDGSDRVLRRLLGENVPNQDDAANRGEAQSEHSADSEAPTPTARGSRNGRLSCRHRGRYWGRRRALGIVGGFMHTT